MDESDKQKRIQSKKQFWSQEFIINITNELERNRRV